MTALSKTMILAAALAGSTACIAAPTVNSFSPAQQASGLDRYSMEQPERGKQFQIGTHEQVRLETDRLSAEVATDLGDRLNAKLQQWVDSAPPAGSGIVITN